MLGDHQAARAHIWDAARALSAEEDRLGPRAGASGSSATASGRRAGWPRPRTWRENLLAASRGLGDLWGEGQSLVLLAACHLEAGDLDEARRCTTEALRAFAELDDRWGGASARLVQGMVGAGRR